MTDEQKTALEQEGNSTPQRNWSRSLKMLKQWQLSLAEKSNACN